MKTLIVRTITGAFFVATILLPLFFWLPGYPYILLVYGILTFDEFHRLFKLVQGKKMFSAWMYVFWFALLTVVWIVVPFFSLAVIPAFAEHWFSGHGHWVAFSMFLLVWTHDTFAYLTGRLFGQHSLFPRISPAKTVEGAVGGILFTAVMAVVLALFLPLPGNLVWWIGNVLIVVIWSVAGDLAESKLKRLAGVKDSGSLLPGHGGVFDRFDALLPVAPLWLLWGYACLSPL